MRHLLLALAAVGLAACQSVPDNADWNVPLTLQTIGPAYADYALEVTDSTDDGEITLAEWTRAGGAERTFVLIDEDRSGVVTRAELVRISSNAQFLDFAERCLETKQSDEGLTPRKFRSPAGVRLLRVEF